MYSGLYIFDFSCLILLYVTLSQIYTFMFYYDGWLEITLIFEKTKMKVIFSLHLFLYNDYIKKFYFETCHIRIKYLQKVEPPRKG